MALRSEKAFGVILAAALAPALWGQVFDFQVRHDHWRKGCSGTLRVDAQGVSYKGAEKHSWEWAWQDIQRFALSPSRVSLMTYRDNRWKLGADREYVFTVASGRDFGAAYGFLKDRLDQRFVAELADQDIKPLWDIPAKRLTRMGGSEGMLLVGEDRIVYRSGNAGASMTWRYTDIQNLSSSGPFQLTLTALQGTCHFQLKQPLEERRYNALWRAIQQRYGLLSGFLVAP